MQPGTASNFDREITPRSALLEINASDQKYKLLLAGWDAEIASLVGPGFASTMKQGTWDPENHAYEWVVMFGSQTAVGDALLKLSSSRQGPDEFAVKALESAGNRWIRQTDLRGLIDKWVVDYAFRQCIAIVEVGKRDPGEGDDPGYMPIARRISPKYYRADALAEESDRERWRAHLNIRPIKEVIRAAESGEEEGWDLDKLRAMRERGLSVSEKRAATMGSGSEGVDREDFAYWEMWVRCDYDEDRDEFGPDDGFNGRIYTIPVDQGDDLAERWIREPRQYFGLRSGPYMVGGSMVVPDEAHRLSPLVATKAQAKYRNDIARAVIAGVDAYKRLLVTRSAKLAKQIQEEPDLNVFAIDDVMDLAQGIASLEVGGPSAQLLLADERADATLQRVSGLADFMKGVSSNITATETEKLANAASARVMRDVDQFQRFLIAVLRAVLFPMYADEDVVADLGSDQELIGLDAQGQPVPVTSMRGEWSGKKTLREFEGLDLMIEPFSMSRSNEQKQLLQAQAIDATLAQFAAMGPALYFVNTQYVLEQKESLLHIPGLRKIIDEERKEQFVGMLLQMQQQAAAPQAQRQAQPRLSFDSSHAGKAGGSSIGGAAQRGTGKPQGMQSGGANGYGGGGGAQTGGTKLRKVGAGAAA